MNTKPAKVLFPVAGNTPTSQIGTEGKTEQAGKRGCACGDMPGERDRFRTPASRESARFFPAKTLRVPPANSPPAIPKISD